MQTLQTENYAVVSPEVSELLSRWLAAKQNLEAAKEAEMALRNAVVFASKLFDPTKDKGTQRVQIGNGWEAKAVKSLTYKIENKKGEAFVALAKLSELGESSARIAQNLFSFDANLRTTEYEKLNADEKVLIDQILTIKPGTPSLELVAPKN